MKRILIYLLLLSSSAFAWYLPKYDRSIEIIWDTSIINDMKEHLMYWETNREMYIQIDSIGINNNGDFTYRIHTHAWFMQDILDFIDDMLLQKDVHTITKTEIKDNGNWKDVDLWFEGIGNFSIDLIWDPLYSGFEY